MEKVVKQYNELGAELAKHFEFVFQATRFAKDRLEMGVLREDLESMTLFPDGYVVRGLTYCGGENKPKTSAKLEVWSEDCLDKMPGIKLFSKTGKSLLTDKNARVGICVFNPPEPFQLLKECHLSFTRENNLISHYGYWGDRLQQKEYGQNPKTGKFEMLSKRQETLNTSINGKPTGESIWTPLKGAIKKPFDGIEKDIKEREEILEKTRATIVAPIKKLRAYKSIELPKNIAALDPMKES